VQSISNIEGVNREGTCDDVLEAGVVYKGPVWLKKTNATTRSVTDCSISKLWIHCEVKVNSITSTASFVRRSSTAKASTIPEPFDFSLSYIDIVSIFRFNFSF